MCVCSQVGECIRMHVRICAHRWMPKINIRYLVSLPSLYSYNRSVTEPPGIHLSTLLQLELHTRTVLPCSYTGDGNADAFFMLAQQTYKLNHLFSPKIICSVPPMNLKNCLTLACEVMDFIMASSYVIICCSHSFPSSVYFEVN